MSHDPHWQLQSQHCEFYQRVNEYTHVILLSQSTFHEDASCILHSAGLDWVNVDSENTSQSFWSRRSHCAGPTMHHSDDNVKSFYAQELAEIAMKIHEDDYKLLGIPHPSWINEMTGELAHEVAKVLAQCPAKSRSTWIFKNKVVNDTKPMNTAARKDGLVELRSSTGLL